MKNACDLERELIPSDLNSLADLLKEIDSKAEDYLNNVATMSGELRKEHLDKIQSLFNKSKEYGDDKVQLAMQTYEMVRIIRDFLNPIAMSQLSLRSFVVCSLI